MNPAVDLDEYFTARLGVEFCERLDRDVGVLAHMNL